MPNIPDVNRNVPQIAPPTDQASLSNIVLTLKQAVDSLAGYRGGLFDRAVTFRDLVNLGFTTQLTLQSASAQVDLASSAAVDAEEAARIAADTALQAAIDAEEAARIAADLAEAAARAAADAVLQAAIDAEEAARIAADSALLGGLADIATSGSASDLIAGTVPPARMIGAYGAVSGVGTLTSGVWHATTIETAYGGTGQTTYTDGQLLIGDTAGDTLVKATLTAPAAGLTITGGAGSITFALADDLAALEAMGGTGLVVRTAANTYMQRTITPPAAGIGVANGDGVAGNPTLSLANDLAAVEGIAGTGLAVRTAADTWTSRTITGTADKITVTNGDGVAGNPTLTIAATYAGQTSIVTLGTVTSGTWNGAVVAGQYGGTGVANTGKTITLGGNLTTSGAFAATLTLTAATNVTLPTTGTLATLAGAENLTNKTITAGTLAGDTTLPGSGQISSTGQIGVFGTPNGQLDLGGTYSADAQLVKIDSTLSNSTTGTQYALNVQPVVTPTGASLGNLYSQYYSPAINSFSGTTSNFIGYACLLRTGASHSGAITSGASFLSLSPSLSGSTFISTFTGFQSAALTNADGATSSTYTNRGIGIGAITASAAGATLNNQGAFITVPSGGATSGTANNRGIYLTGNGGTAAGGTVNNFALYSDSTAPFQIGGMLYFLGSTSSFPALKRSTTHLQVRLADDSGFAPASASTFLCNGTTYANRPASPTAGMIAYITDCNTTTWRATAAGGGANKCIIWYDGTNWLVMG